MKRQLLMMASLLLAHLTISCKAETPAAIQPRVGENNAFGQNAFDPAFGGQTFINNGPDYRCTVAACPKVNMNIEFIDGLIEEGSQALLAYRGVESLWSFKATPQEDQRLVSLFLVDNNSSQNEFVNLNGQEFSGEMLVRHNAGYDNSGTLKIVARDMTMCARENQSDRTRCLNFEETQYQQYDTVLPYPYVILDNPVDEFEKVQKKEKSKKFWGTVLNIFKAIKK